MELVQHAEIASPAPRIYTVVISQVRFYRDCLVEILAHDPIVEVRASYATLEQAFTGAATLRPRMVLLDVAFPNGTAVAAHLRAILPSARIVVFAVAEKAETVLRWAAAGITGYVPNTASLSELPSLLHHICSGEQFCSSRIASALLQHVGGKTNVYKPGPDGRTSLTNRERVILELIAEGLTNKEIARQLSIGVGTTKTHVHHILGKLHLSNRVQVSARMSGRLGDAYDE